jgi:hypothetical protein
MTTINIEGYGEITFGVLGNRTPARLPWYKDAAKVPAEIREEAERTARELSADTREYEWRMTNWSAAISGWSFSVRLHYPWFMMSPAEALEWMSGLCMHDWQLERTYNSENKILGTYDRGHVNKCTKCGKEEYVRTAYNNYSGD